VKVADTILELREAKGDLELDDLNQVPYLRITPQLLDCLEFTSFENKEGVGSLYDRHRGRVRSVDKLIGKWDGTGQHPLLLLIPKLYRPPSPLSLVLTSAP
jgi:hypothetical protein